MGCPVDGLVTVLDAVGEEVPEKVPEDDGDDALLLPQPVTLEIVAPTTMPAKAQPPIRAIPTDIPFVSTRVDPGRFSLFLRPHPDVVVRRRLERGPYELTRTRPPVEMR
jgi:hypothetical protein